MLTTNRLRNATAVFLSLCALFLGVHAVHAQPPSPRNDPDVVPDDLLTLVVGTRFVTPATDTKSARAQFTDQRIPLSAFNETDRCIDQRALEVAMEYFTTLGRVLGKAGHYYFVPDTEIKKFVVTCEKLNRHPPQAWVDQTTGVIAFGQVVSTVDAPALEQSIR